MKKIMLSVMTGLFIASSAMALDPSPVSATTYFPSIAADELSVGSVDVASFVKAGGKTAHTLFTTNIYESGGSSIPMSFDNGYEQYFFSSEYQSEYGVTNKIYFPQISHTPRNPSDPATISSCTIYMWEKPSQNVWITVEPTTDTSGYYMYPVSYPLVNQPWLLSTNDSVWKLEFALSPNDHWVFINAAELIEPTPISQGN